MCLRRAHHPSIWVRGLSKQPANEGGATEDRVHSACQGPYAHASIIREFPCFVCMCDMNCPLRPRASAAEAAAPPACGDLILSTGTPRPYSQGGRAGAMPRSHTSRTLSMAQCLALTPRARSLWRQCALTPRARSLWRQCALTPRARSLWRQCALTPRARSLWRLCALAHLARALFGASALSHLAHALYGASALSRTSRALSMAPVKVARSLQADPTWNDTPTTLRPRECATFSSLGASATSATQKRQGATL